MGELYTAVGACFPSEVSGEEKNIPVMIDNVTTFDVYFVSPFVAFVNYTLCEV